MKQAMFVYVNHARIRCWNQPMRVKFLAQGNNGGPLLGLELTTDRHPTTMSQTRYPLDHAAPYKHFITRCYILDIIIYGTKCILWNRLFEDWIVMVLKKNTTWVQFWTFNFSIGGSAFPGNPSKLVTHEILRFNSMSRCKV